MDRNKGGAAILIFAALIVGGIFLMTRRSSPVPKAPSTWIPSKAYHNREVREITYNDDGLPVRIVIDRDASVT